MLGTQWFSRPRCLYAVIFALISVTGGRFLAPFLEHEGHLSEGDIGTVLAAQKCMSTLSGSLGGALADRLERRYPCRGRAFVLMVGSTAGTLVFLLLGMHQLFPASPFFRCDAWFILLRCCYSLSMSLVFPVMDGMTLSFMQQEQQQRPSSSSSSSSGDFGKERLYGAVSWAAMHLIIGPLMDRTNPNDGFTVFYPLAVLVLVITITTVVLHVRSQTTHRHHRIKHRSSDIMTPDIDVNDDVDCDRSALESPGRSANSWGEDDGGATKASLSCSEGANADTCAMGRLSLDTEPNYGDGDGIIKDRSSSPSMKHNTGMLSLQSTAQTAAAESAAAEASATTSFTQWNILRILTGTTLSSCLLFGIFCMAFGQVVVESLVFLYFEFLGSSYTMMGITVLLTVALEIPIFQIAPRLLEWLGTERMFLLGAAAYIVRVIGYSIIPTGQIVLVLVFEPLHGVTYACVLTATMEYAAKLVPTGYEATGQGLVSMIRGISSILGLLWGGYGSAVIGPRLMYRVTALVVLLGCAPLTLLAIFPSGWVTSYSQLRQTPLARASSSEAGDSPYCDDDDNAHANTISSSTGMLASNADACGDDDDDDDANDVVTSKSIRGQQSHDADGDIQLV